MYDLDNVNALINSIQSLNEWLGHKALRTYQVDVLKGMGFNVVSPFDGNRSEMEVSYLLASDMIAYAFQHGRFYLITGPQHEGYPLALLLGSQGLMWHLPSSPMKTGILQPYSGTDAERILSSINRLRAIPVQDSPVHALFGDGNFAHLAWNGLGAFDTLARIEIDFDNVRFVSRCDPLGDPRQLCPILHGVMLDGWDERPDLHRGRSFRYATFLGAAYLSAETTEAVLRVCHSRVSELFHQKVERLRQMEKKIVWISLRNRHRDCTNQVEFISKLIMRLLEQYQVALIFDGFSFPDCAYPDFFTEFRDRVNDDFQRVAFHCGPLLEEMITSGTAVVLNGSSLYDSIAMASLADFYICHAGTQQHKIAWFHNVPGVLHLPNPSSSAENWYAAQCSSSCTPRCLPADMIVSEQNAGISPSNQSYQILVDPAVNFIVSAAAAYLAP